MFPDKVKVQTLDLNSLIKFGGCTETSNTEDRGHELLPRRLYDKASKAFGNPLRSKLATASAYFEREDGVDRYLDTGLLADWNDRRFTKEFIKRVKEAERHGRKQKVDKEEEGSGEEGELSDSKKRKVEVLVLD